jgi:mono/diheme cytochrome c family protein
MGAQQSETPHHDTGATSPAAAKGPIRISMEELHAHGGVPPGWQFSMPAGNPINGRAVFEKFECFQCHTVQGEVFAGSPPQASTPGPALTGMGSHHPDAYLAESILHPNAVVVTGPGYTDPDGKSVMPDYRDSLSVAELIDLVAYLKSLDGEHAHEEATHQAGHPTPSPLLDRVVGDYRVRLEYHPPRAHTHDHKEHGHGGHGGGATHARATSHLMAFIDDTKTGQPVPYLPVTLTITAPKSAPAAFKLLPMVGERGFHYGADLSLPSSAAKLKLSIGATRIRVMPQAAGHFSSPHEVSLDWAPQPTSGSGRRPHHHGHGKPTGHEGH